MSDSYDSDRSAIGLWGALRQPICLAGAAVGLLIGVGGVTLAFATSQAESVLDRCLEAIIYLAAGLGLGVLLVGLGILHASIGQLRRVLLRLESSEAQFDAKLTALSDRMDRAMTQAGDNTRVLSVGDPGAAGEAIWSDVLRLMEQVHDNSLLSEEERIARRTRLFDEAVREAERAFSEAQARGDHAQGRRAVEALLRRFPDEPRAKALARRGEQAREAQEADDVATVTRRVNDLISISAWSRAREQVQQLLTRHPDSAPVRQLQLRVEKEYRDFQDEQRRRVYAEVQRFVTRRRWEEACAAARAFLERFPDTSEASALSMQIPTLQANAEIEVRQNLEARIMLFARTGRYIEAAELARTVIRQYPDSPQAEALKGQLPRLEELAHDPNAPPARVRLE